jgi:hypothetical protein
VHPVKHVETIPLGKATQPFGVYFIQVDPRSIPINVSYDANRFDLHFISPRIKAGSILPPPQASVAVLAY